mgnify:CR=1 FL=1
MSAGTQVVNTLVNSPLPFLIVMRGVSIPPALAALDLNSLAIAQQMATTTVDINNASYNLINLGFTPTFYAFTDAMVSAKLEFSVAESTEFSIGASVGANIGVMAVSVSASYARKFEMSAEGSSSISARLVSLPAPERFNEVLQELANPA